MSIPCQEFQQSRQEMLPQHGMVNGDGVRDEGDLVGGRPSHAVELVVLIGECQGLNLHHAHAFHGCS